MNAPKPEQIVQSRTQNGPIRHETLPEGLLEFIAKVHRKIGSYLDMNLEQFEIVFMRAERPEAEVAMWNGIAMAWDKFRQKYVGEFQLPHDESKALIAALIAISTGIQNPAQLGVPVTVGVGLLACFNEVLGP